MKQRPDRHLHGARAPDQLEELVDQDRDDGDVQQIPPADRTAGSGAGWTGTRSSVTTSLMRNGAARMRSATRTASAISLTPWTRTMWAPARTQAVTAAAVAQSRSVAGRSPIAVFRNDFRDGPDQDRPVERRPGGPGARATSHVLRGALGEAQARDRGRSPRARCPPPSRGRWPLAAPRQPPPATSSIDGLAIHLARSPAVVHQHDRPRPPRRRPPPARRS